MASRNWQNIFLKGQGFSEQAITQFSSLEVDVATALAYVNGALTVVNVKAAAYGAVGDGVTNDTAAITAAVAALPATGGVLFFPPGTYRHTTPITISTRSLVFGPGAVLKPSVDTDVVRLTAIGAAVEGISIDGSAIGAGVGSGIVVGYGGANAQNCKIGNVTILSMRGHGLLWEQGSMLVTSALLIQSCFGDGIRCTENYDDNNHGFIEAHVVNCVGIGVNVRNHATIANNSSRAHAFPFIKVFGCTGGGVRIETGYNHAVLFLESNTTPALNFTATSKGNQVQFIGVPASYTDTTDAGTGNSISGPTSFDEFVYKQLNAEKLRVRKTTVGSLSLEPTADNVFTFTPADTTGNTYLVVTKGPAASITLQPDNLKVLGALIEKRSVLAYSATIATDASLGTDFDITATNGTAFTISSPTNPVDGQRITYTIRNTFGVLGVLTWGAAFKLSAWTQPANGFSRSITFRYDGTNWVEIGRTPADVPN